MGNYCCGGDDDEYGEMQDGYHPPTVPDDLPIQTIEVRPQMTAPSKFAPKDPKELAPDEFQQIWKESYIFEYLEYPLNRNFSREELLETLAKSQISVLAKSGDQEKIFKLYVYANGVDSDYYLIEILIDFDASISKLKLKSNHDIDDFIVYFEQQLKDYIKI